MNRLAVTLQLFQLLCLTLVIFAVGCKKKLSQGELRGEELYRIHCSECHDQTPEGLLKTPPKLAGLFHSGTLPDGVPANDQKVHEVILHGLRTMPAFNGRLRDDEIDYIVAYLHSKE